MKVALVNYQHASNGISLSIDPETDIEAELLRTFWRHGKLETGYPVSDGNKRDTGFYITFKPVARADEVAKEGK